MREARARLAGASARLELVSPEAVLKRGYALVFDLRGHPVTSAGAVAPASRLRLHFADGDVHATAAPRRDAARRKLPLDQAAALPGLLPAKDDDML